MEFFFALPSLLRPVLRCALAAGLLGACALASADGLLDRARERHRLMAGVDYLPPPHVTSVKFRTPETVDIALADDVARQLGLPVETVRIDRRMRTKALASGQADLLLTMAAGDDPLYQNALVVPTGYAVGPMAIMRTDTTIRSWDQLRGRTVCLAQGGHYVGTMAARYGAIEKVMRAPADSLLAVRTGACDAAVHDNALLEELIKLPEWKKFSARLTSDERTPLVFALPARDSAAAAALRQATTRWQANGHIGQLLQKMARSIAFEVYLDQDVPDCH